MAEWLFEAGTGEARAALVEDGVVVEACIEPESEAPRAGGIQPARLADILVPGRIGLARLADGGEVLVEPLPRALTQGAKIKVEIVREAIPEPGRVKRAKGRIAASDAPIAEGLPLGVRIAATGVPVRELHPSGPDLLEQAGWSEILEAARDGHVDFAGGALRISLTPAMTLIDVDGTLPPDELAVAGSRAAAQAIRRFGIGGSIGVDLPTTGNRGVRQAAAEAFDAVLPLPFERTAVNGFGFMQIVRPRPRASLCELLAYAPAASAARALLRRAERHAPGGVTLTAAPAVIDQLQAHPHWLDLLSRRVGGAVALRPDVRLAIWSGHVS